MEENGEIKYVTIILVGILNYQIKISKSQYNNKRLLKMKRLKNKQGHACGYSRYKKQLDQKYFYHS
jgi:hypothetical protein